VYLGEKFLFFKAGLAETIQFILGKFEDETADRLANNVFLTGGLASIPGLNARLEKEIQVSSSVVP
jgi:actin-related protein 5